LVGVTLFDPHNLVVNLRVGLLVEQVITQVIKVLRAGQIHNHLLRDHPKTQEELYDKFQKFNRAEVPKESKNSRLTKYSKSRKNAMSFDTSHKQVNSIDSDGCGPPENWEKKFGPSILVRK
jgi:hypothetical protein